MKNLQGHEAHDVFGLFERRSRENNDMYSSVQRCKYARKKQRRQHYGYSSGIDDSFYNLDLGLLRRLAEQLRLLERGLT